MLLSILGRRAVHLKVDKEMGRKSQDSHFLKHCQLSHNSPEVLHYFMGLF